MLQLRCIVTGETIVPVGASDVSAVAVPLGHTVSPIPCAVLKCALSISRLADAVKRESESIIDHLYTKRQDLTVATLALHCAYLASLRALRDSMPPNKVNALLDVLRERDDAAFYGYDKKVGIA